MSPHPCEQPNHKAALTGRTLLEGRDSVQGSQGLSAAHFLLLSTLSFQAGHGQPAFGCSKHEKKNGLESLTPELGKFLLIAL